MQHSEQGESFKSEKEASTAVKDMKTITQSITINSADYGAIGSMETHKTMNGM
jgi:hypothetical protein